MKLRLLLLFCVWVAATAEGRPPDSAEEVILQVSGKQSQVDAGNLWRRVPQLIKERASLSGEEAAQQWFELFKIWCGKGVPKTNGYNPSLFAAIPTPAGWKPLDDLVGKVQLQPEKARIMLELITATLLQDQERQWKLVGELAKLDPAKRSEAKHLYYILASQTDDPKKAAEAFQSGVDYLESINEDTFGDFSWPVPDFLLRMDEQEASSLLLKALSVNHLTLRFSSEKLRDRARELIATRADELKGAPWPLIEVKSDADAALVLGLNSKFPDTITTEAAVAYLSYQVKKGNIDAALELFNNVGEDVLTGEWIHELSRRAGEQLVEKKHKENLHAFLRKLVEKNSGRAAYWSALTKSARTQGDETKVFAGLEAAVEANPDKTEWEESLTRTFAFAKLEGGDVKAAVDFLWKRQTNVNEAAGSLAELCAIARVTADAKLMDRVIESAGQLDFKTIDPSLLGPLVGELIERKDYDRAWELALKITAHLVGKKKGLRVCDSALATLCELFVAESRGEEALKLMQESPSWTSAQLARLVDVESWTGRKLGLIASDAFLQAGRTQDAVEVLKTMIFRRIYSDAVFEKLVEIEGQALLPYLETLAKLNPFQERPLIWKAVLLLRAGKTAEAEAAIRAAIAVDPSDGESGKNDRLRTYAVLADILEAKGGAAEEVAMARNVVKAVRMAEKADDLLEIGLERQGIELYQKALEIFSEAYCIHSRLAIRLAEAGQMEEAIRHYEKAYELMPDSFGRVESHCLGCEQAFSGETAQHLAERTFIKLIKARPDSPRLHYLLGYLRQNEGRYKEAAESYREAVRLDPDYYNAWMRLADIGEGGGIPFREREKAAFELLRLDPLNYRWSNGRCANVANLKALWEILETNIARVKPVDRPFWFPMTAAIQAGHTAEYTGYRRQGEPGGFTNPAEGILNQSVIKLAIDSLTAVAR